MFCRLALRSRQHLTLLRPRSTLQVPSAYFSRQHGHKGQEEEGHPVLDSQGDLMEQFLFVPVQDHPLLPYTKTALSVSKEQFKVRERAITNTGVGKPEKSLCLCSEE